MSPEWRGQGAPTGASQDPTSSLESNDTHDPNGSYGSNDSSANHFTLIGRSTDLIYGDGDDFGGGATGDDP